MGVFEKDGFVLAIITGMLYLGAFIRILASAHFYGIPMEVMSVNFFQLTQAAISGLVLLSGMITIPLVIYLWLRFGAKRPKLKYFIFASFLLALITFFMVKDEERVGVFIITVAMFFLPIATFYLIRLIFNRSLADLLINHGEEVLKRLLSKASVRFALLFIVCFSSIIIEYVAAYAANSSHKNYFVFNKNGYYAVINPSSDNIVAKKIINGELVEGFVIFKVEDLKEVEIKERDIHFLNDGATGHFTPLSSNKV